MRLFLKIALKDSLGSIFGATAVLFRSLEISALQTYPSLHPRLQVGPLLGCLPRVGAQSNPKSNRKMNFLTRKSGSEVAFSGQKVTFGVTFWGTLGGDPFLVTFELLLTFRGFGGSRRSAASQPKRLAFEIFRGPLQGLYRRRPNVHFLLVAPCG